MTTQPLSDGTGGRVDSLGSIRGEPECPDRCFLPHGLLDIVDPYPGPVDLRGWGPDDVYEACHGPRVDIIGPVDERRVWPQDPACLHERVECCREVAYLLGVVGLEVTRGQGESGDGEVQLVEVHARRYPPIRGAIPTGAAA